MSYGPMMTPRAVRMVTPQAHRPVMVTPHARRPVPIARARGAADVARAAVRVVLAIGFGAAVGSGAALLGDRPAPADAMRPAPVGPPTGPPPAVLLADLDATLAVAIEQGQLAALQANDVALRAFAVQQVGRYAELRAELRGLARRLGAGGAAGRPAAAQGDSLQALKLVRGTRFDRAYVRQALDVHQLLLTDLDAALRIVENAEVRQALAELRGTMDADRPTGTHPR